MPDLLIEHAYFPPVFASRAESPPAGSVHIVGISCSFDLIARDVPAPALEIGDIVAFLDTGAYQDAAASGTSNWSMTRTRARYLVSGGQARLVKRHETVDEVLARDEPRAASVTP